MHWREVNEPKYWRLVFQLVVDRDRVSKIYFLRTNNHDLETIFLICFLSTTWFFQTPKRNKHNPSLIPFCFTTITKETKIKTKKNNKNQTKQNNSNQSIHSTSNTQNNVTKESRVISFSFILNSFPAHDSCTIYGNQRFSFPG